MKISVTAPGPKSPHRCKVEIWMSEEEARMFPLGLAHLSDYMELCLKEHLLTGHRASRITK